jgi:hypothetical protein
VPECSRNHLEHLHRPDPENASRPKTGRASGSGNPGVSGVQRQRQIPQGASQERAQDHRAGTADT